MEKLKAKHDHLFTKLLKVGIFALVLLLPFFVFMPTAFYYGFNEHAVQAQGNRNQITLKQEIENGKPTSFNNWHDNTDHFEYDPSENELYASSFANDSLENTTQIIAQQNDIMYCQFENYTGLAPLFNSIDVLIKGDNSLYFTINIELSQNYKYYFGTAQYQEDESDGYLNFEFDGLYQGIGFKNIQLFNLTAIYGSGNEPTADEFATFIGDNYYEYGQEYTYTLDSYWNITDNMSLAWETTWKTPLFAWTENSPFETSINGFTSIFNISQESGIDNLLAYIMTISCIYVVIDIVLGLFTWITHTIGER